MELDATAASPPPAAIAATAATAAIATLTVPSISLLPRDLCDIHAEQKGCFAEELPHGFTNLIDFELDFEGELNDGREVGAPDLEFWLEIGIGWTYDIRARKPLSYAVMVEDHFGMVDGHQHTYENYHWVPSEGEWVNYYTVSPRAA